MNETTKGALVLGYALLIMGFSEHLSRRPSVAFPAVMFTLASLVFGFIGSGEITSRVKQYWEENTW